MKVRINKQSIRFRLDKVDIDELAKSNRILQSTQLGKGTSMTLEYELIFNPLNDFQISFQNNRISVSIPMKIGREWVETENVGFDRTLELNEQQKIYVLIEKDFQCLVPRPNENEENNFENPLKVS